MRTGQVDRCCFCQDLTGTKSRLTTGEPLLVTDLSPTRFFVSWLFIPENNELAVFAYSKNY